MDIKPENFPLIIALVGLLGVFLGGLVTAFLAEFRSWLENRRQNKRQLKSVLYHQIELLGTMFALDKEFHEFYLQAMSEELNNQGVPFETAKAVFEQIPTDLFNILEKVKAESIKEVIQKHEETILKLSEIDPLLASKMSYRSRMHLPEQMEIFVSEMNKIPSEQNDLMNEFSIHIAHWQQVKARKKMINSLDNGIIEIAWRINWLTWWKTKNEMKNWRNKIQKDIKIEVKEYISETQKFSIKNREKLTKEIAQVVNKKTEN